MSCLTIKQKQTCLQGCHSQGKLWCEDVGAGQGLLQEDPHGLHHEEEDDVRGTTESSVHPEQPGQLGADDDSRQPPASHLPWRGGHHEAGRQGGGLLYHCGRVRDRPDDASWYPKLMVSSEFCLLASDCTEIDLFVFTRESPTNISQIKQREAGRVTWCYIKTAHFYIWASKSVYLGNVFVAFANLFTTFHRGMSNTVQGAPTPQTDINNTNWQDDQ